MKSIIKSVKGTVDFYPEEMALRTWLYDTLRNVSESFGYQEWEGPILETIDLYAAKSGEELVKKQSFVFADRGGKMITLRPELTPSLARMVAKRQHQLSYPLRWWSYGPMWRYERPQKGRTREFFQWNIDLIGVDSPEADAELVAIAARFLQKAGLSADQVCVYVNNRRLMDTSLGGLGISETLRADVIRLIDRRDKLSSEAWETYAAELGLSGEQVEGLKALLGNTGLWKESEELVRFFETIEALGVKDYVRFAPHIIRGLDYYTGIVFEARDYDGEFRAILGGGRYDNLVGDVGGSKLSGTGFAMGDKVIQLVLKKFGCLPAPHELGNRPVLVTVFDDSSLLPSTMLAAELRAAGLKVAIYPKADKLGKQFKYADRIGARVAVVFGPDEQASGQVAVKDLRARTQENVLREHAAKLIAKMLESQAAS